MSGIEGDWHNQARNADYVTNNIALQMFDQAKEKKMKHGGWAGGRHVHK